MSEPRRPRSVSAHPGGAAAPAPLSIGAVSRATGVPVETLRTWERRYGFPEPLRRASGHRRYEEGVVPRIKRIRRALSLGHAASVAVPASPEDLDALLAREHEDPVDETLVRRLEEAARALDGAAMGTALREAATRHGAPALFQRVLCPFLTRVGDAWEAGELDVFVEHFASARLAEFLSARWWALAEGAGRRAVVLATLPGEEHTLGLHMAAYVLACERVRPVVLGRDSPPREIAAAVAHAGASAVLIGVSSAAEWESTHAALAELRGMLGGSGAELLVGAPCAPRLEGTTWIADFAELQRWAVDAA